MYGRNWYNVVKQFLSSQEKINEHEHMNIFQKVSKFVHIWKKNIIFDIHLHAVSGVHGMYALLAGIISSFAYFFVIFPKWECNLDEGRTFSILFRAVSPVLGWSQTFENIPWINGSANWKKKNECERTL